MDTPTTIGTCSLCGGPVQVPSVWMGVVPPTPACASCGATAAQHGPVIPMLPAQAPVVPGRVPRWGGLDFLDPGGIVIGDVSDGRSASNAEPLAHTLMVGAGQVAVRAPAGTPWVEVTYTDPGPIRY
jgi:hypothetical protein